MGVQAVGEAEEPGEEVPVQQVIRSVDVKFIDPPARSNGTPGMLRLTHTTPCSCWLTGPLPA